MSIAWNERSWEQDAQIGETDRVRERGSRTTSRSTARSEDHVPQDQLLESMKTSPDPR